MLIWIDRVAMWKQTNRSQDTTENLGIDRHMQWMLLYDQSSVSI